MTGTVFVLTDVIAICTMRFTFCSMRPVVLTIVSGAYISSAATFFTLKYFLHSKSRVSDRT